MIQHRKNLGIVHIRELLTHDPTNAVANLALGQFQFERGEFENAESSFRASVESDPTADALNGLAWVMNLNGKHEESLEVVDRALAMNPSAPYAHDTRGVTLTSLNRFEEAKESLLLAIQLAPGHVDYQLHLAEVYEGLGEIDRVISILEALLARTDLSGDQMMETDDRLKRLQREGATMPTSTE